MSSNHTCDVCATAVRNIETRPREGYRFRQYRCEQGHRYATVEIPIPEDMSATETAALMKLALEPRDMDELIANTQSALARMGEIWSNRDTDGG